MFLSLDQGACLHFLIKMRQAEQNEQPGGKWGERKRASGSPGILIETLIVMVRAQRQNKSTGQGGGEMVTEAEGPDAQAESD